MEEEALVEPNVSILEGLAPRSQKHSVQQLDPLWRRTKVGFSLLVARLSVRYCAAQMAELDLILQVLALSERPSWLPGDPGDIPGDADHIECGEGDVEFSR